MNCKQAENLLPLYVSHDLDERRERSIAGHVQDCANCRRAVAEYQASRQLLRDFAPPVFEESVFDEMRQKVWRSIEAESAVPSFADAVISWFRPRLVGAFAVAVLIIVSVCGIYLVTRPRAVQYSVEGIVRARNIKDPDRQVKVSFPRDPSSGRGQRQGIRHPEYRGNRSGAPDRLRTPVANAPDVAVVMPDSSPIKGLPDESLAGSTGEQRRPLRLEIQTKNPNIRIIWFAQRDTKSVSPNSKGT